MRGSGSNIFDEIYRDMYRSFHLLPNRCIKDFSQMWRLQYKQQLQECLPSLQNFEIIWSTSSRNQISRKTCGIFEWTPFFLHFVFFFFYLLLQKHSSKVKQDSFPTRLKCSPERGFSWAQGLVDEVTNPTWLRNELDKGVRAVYNGEDAPQEVS